MRRLTSIAMSLVMATGAAGALADRNDHRGGHHGGYHGKDNGRHYGKDYGRHGKYSRGHHDWNRGSSHGRHHDYHWKYTVKHRPSYRGHYYPRPDYYKPRHYYGYYYPLGAALVGTAVSYSLYHSHDGVRCYERHATTSYASPASEVMGCHRIERYPDGTERRVDLPVSECY